MKEPPLTVRVSEYQFLCYLLKDPDPESPLNLASLTLLLRIFTARVWHGLSQQELPWKEQCPFHCPFLSAGACCSALLPAAHPRLPCTPAAQVHLCPLVPFLFLTLFYVKITLPAIPELWSTSIDGAAGWSILLISFKCLCQNDHTMLGWFPNLQVHCYTFFWYLYMSPLFKIIFNSVICIFFFFFF